MVSKKVSREARLAAAGLGYFGEEIDGPVDRLRLEDWVALAPTGRWIIQNLTYPLPPPSVNPLDSNGSRRTVFDAFEKGDLEEARRLLVREERRYRPGFEGYDFREQRDGPLTPEVAFYFWRYATFSDAVRAWTAQRAPQSIFWNSPTIDTSEEATALRRAIGRDIVKALGTERNDLRAARKAIHDSLDKSLLSIGPMQHLDGPIRQRQDYKVVGARTARDLKYVVLPLLDAYEDARRFFSEGVLQMDYRFGLFKAGYEGMDGTLVSGVIESWGVAALLNPEVYAVFAKLPPEALDSVLAKSGGKQHFAEGRRPGSRDGVPRKSKVDNLKTKAEVWSLADEFEKTTREKRGAGARAVLVVANREKRKPAAIRRRMARASMKK